MTHTFTLPFAVGATDNQRYMKSRSGRLILQPKYRDAKTYARTVATNARVAALVGRPFVGTLALHARVWFPDQRKRDVANLRKYITDSLTGVWYADDSQLWRETWERMGVASTGRIEITLTDYRQEDA